MEKEAVESGKVGKGRRGETMEVKFVVGVFGVAFVG